MFQDFNRPGVSVGIEDADLNVGQGEQPYLVDVRCLLYICVGSRFLLLPPLPEIKNE